MKILVAGGSGFIGSHVANMLSETGHQVTIFDNTRSKELHPSQSFIQGDILTSNLMEILSDQEIVYNFAGLANIEECLENPVETASINIIGNTRLLDAASKNNLKRFIFASTIYVSGNSGGYYRVSKHASEMYCEEYFQQTGLPYTILRYGTLYGPKADNRNSVYRYLSEALLNRKIVCYATGNELREYIHVDDASRASIDVLAKDYENQVILITGQHSMRFRDMLEMIKEIVGHDVEIEYNQPSDSRAHYSITPYSFKPAIAKKLIQSHYLDLGQGLIDCLEEIHSNSKKENNS